VRGDGEADDVMDAVELPLPLLDPVLLADCDGDVVAVPLVLALADCVADALADEEPLPVFVPEEENDDEAVAVAESEDDAVAVAESEDDAVAVAETEDDGDWVADADELRELVPLAVPD
jgi:hypothetical protein